ncbi:GNAT family N-acetyltransferase [Pseudoxanthomonas kalamensis DSM 18571]|uniref:GNAT family N-acetyltransferase n=1 Tax=Pseudoxanthomonas kalamensis TaxID=289483 RepID=UPI001391ECDF|nr:GNAT family N-acetyltransferase [Pseudoxanthomonas kalamensis]KAF1710418.1 GNAT family N-acetyltransferase [Pseudoxanthomonas kalamensis DSM 18571]
MDSTHATGLSVAIFGGEAIAPHLDDVARLRMEVFRDWPYLYDGDMAYERDYLAAYARSPRSLFVLVFEDERVVGASTGLPLLDDTPAFRAPFAGGDVDAARVFYFGESVLLPECRGRGIGHAFFDAREVHARRLGYRWTAFCAVDRDDDDPRRPAGHRGNEAFWRKRGYRRQPEMTMQLPWEEPGQGEVIHPLTFWLRDWEEPA